MKVKVYKKKKGTTGGEEEHVAVISDVDVTEEEDIEMRGLRFLRLHPIEIDKFRPVSDNRTNISRFWNLAKRKGLEKSKWVLNFVRKKIALVKKYALWHECENGV